MRYWLAAFCCSVAIPIFAEQAPVYEADSYPPFDGEVPAAQQAPAAATGGSHQPAAVQQQDDAASTAVPASADQRLGRIEQQLRQLQGTDYPARLDSLQSEVQTLRGQVEELTHKLQQLQNQQSTQPANKSTASADSAGDGDQEADKGTAAAVVPKSPASRATQIAKPVVAKVVPVKASSNQPDVAEEQQIYQTAYNLIKQKKYNDAVKALQGMLQKYPTGQFASNAHYWLGELYGLMGKNDEALTEFSAVVKSYPDSPRVSDAQLKLGLLYVAQTKWPDAKAAFKKVISHYPGTASARLASEQLKQLKEAGN